MTDPSASPHPAAPHRRGQGLPAFDGQWLTVVVDLPPECIQLLCVLFEGYDNLALVRTPRQGQGRVHVYAWSGHLPTVERLLADLAATIPLTIASVQPGMADFAALWNE